MINLSIVTGTYNRLKLLQRMVNSVRTSVGKGLNYEIVVVDGGSKDGTIQWCRGESDIRLIEQGKLLGAVKAFNEGAYSSKGKYVILANDDITFLEDAILRSYAFMETNLEAGIGCFYQDRYKKNWHVDRMGAIGPDGEPSGMYYGQVCIVPKWLGDKVGWWGDYLHTYGGDNELSSNIAELGYRVVPIECACIHDDAHDDELRRINHPNKKGEIHPDSLAFREKWGRGPKLGAVKVRVAPEGRKRLLYAPIYEPGNKLQKNTKWGLLEALKKYYDVQEIDYREGHSPFYKGLTCLDDIYYVAQAFKPDIFLIQAHDANYFTIEIMQFLKEQFPDAVFISWNGDYIRNNLFDPNYQHLMKLFDLATFCTADIFPLYRELGVNIDYWQIGYEEYKELPLLDSDKRYDAIFQGNEYSEQRTYLGHILREMKDVNIGIFGFWKSLKPDGASYYDYSLQDKLYRCSKICISDQQHAQSIGYVSNRLFHALRSGSFVLQQYIPEMERYIHLREGEHVITWKTADELPELIRYWLPREKERREIAEAGKKVVMHEHNFDKRVEEFNAFYRAIFTKKKAKQE